jgi:hypothetical protein
LPACDKAAVSGRSHRAIARIVDDVTGGRRTGWSVPRLRAKRHGPKLEIMMRPSRRAPDELRPVSIERNVARYAEGSTSPATPRAPA